MTTLPPLSTTTDRSISDFASRQFDLLSRCPPEIVDLAVVFLDLNGRLALGPLQKAIQSLVERSPWPAVKLRGEEKID
jgi:hypothetical protein